MAQDPLAQMYKDAYSADCCSDKTETDLLYSQHLLAAAMECVACNE